MRRFYSIGMLGVVTLLSYFAAFSPDLRSPWAPAAALAGLGLARTTGPLFPRRPALTPLLVLAVLVLLAWPIAVLFLIFGEFDYGAFIAHYIDGIAGFTLWDSAQPVLQSGVCLAVYAAGSAALAMRIGTLVLLRLAYLPLLAMNPMLMESIRGLAAPRLDFAIEQMLVDPVPLPDTGQNPDILMLFLEGTERGFADLPQTAAAYAPVKALEAEGVTFTNVAELVGTGWSSAGIMAATCGLNQPIPWSEFFHIRQKDERYFDTFACLTDMLAARNYDMATLIGADANFAGHSDFFAWHGVSQNHGRDTVRAVFGQDYYDRHQFGWGVDDQAITETAARLFLDLGRDGRPRFLLAATMGPHADDVFLPPGCLGNETAVISTNLVASLRCQVQHAMRLIEAVRRAERPNGLRIIVLSDHLNRSLALKERLPAETRRNTVLLLGGERGRVIDRPGTMVDVYPTLLEWLGLARPPVGAGIGRSLLGSEPNLLDRTDLETLAAALRYTPALWNAMMAKTAEARLLP